MIILYGQGCKTRLFIERFSSCNGLRLHLQMTPWDHCLLGTLATLISCSLFNVLTPTTLPLLYHHHFLDLMTDLNLNCRKCCREQHGSEERDSLSYWISESGVQVYVGCKIVRHAKYVWAMIGPNEHLHRWTESQKRIERVFNINASTKIHVEGVVRR